MPLTYYLDANYPNPFNHTTRIAFGLPDDATVKLRNFNILGQEVAILIDDYKIAGRYNLEWQMERYLSSGIYLYSLEIRSNNQTVFSRHRKMLYVK
ncbi:MAG: T9SS type A sorting domain-containing protein [FCB group bacterium]|nr:T9SS type A sorting domain-containing protein [FCB group bacterium]